MSSNELVSIIIPIYNSEKYLKECLNSLFEQTYENIEIIAVDDGSTDTSLQILQDYSDRLKIFSQENNGLYSALKVGISKIHGKWCKWFSPDDVLYPNAIEIQVNEAKKYPDNTILYSNWNIIDETGKLLREFCESDNNDLSRFEYNVRLLYGQQINVNTALIPSILFQKPGVRNLDESVAIDYDFFLNSAIFHDVKFHLIPQPLVKYRIHSAQLSHKNISKTLDFISDLKDELLMKLDDSLRRKYNHAIEEYKKTQPRKNKTLEFGMKILSSTPSWASDRILTLYLNKIRHNR
jgi:glycosyltransferase involved in cell wall biosynthesis